MLWVDDYFVTTDDLQSLDPEVAELAAVTGIPLADIIRLAKDDCRNFLSRFMSFSNLGPTDLAVRDVNLPITVSSLRYNYAGFAQLVVSGPTDTAWSALKAWVANKTLLRLYKAAVNKAADRYSDRYNVQFEDVQREHWPNLKRRGLPMVFNPLPAPGAIEELAGTFDEDNISLVDGTGTLTEDVEFAITWVGSKYQSSSDKRNGESYRSQRIPATGLVGKVFSVSKAGLTPPDGKQPKETQASCRYSPGLAVGWNVWAGKPGASMYRQNGALIPLTQDSFVLPSDPVFSGELLDIGQVEEIVLDVTMTLVRGS